MLVHWSDTPPRVAPQMAEIALYNKEGEPLLLLKASQGSRAHSPDTERVENLIDGQKESKWLDANRVPFTVRAQLCVPLFFSYFSSMLHPPSLFCAFLKGYNTVLLE